MMTRKDFQLIAQVFNKERKHAYSSEIILLDDIEAALADAFKKAYPNFNRNKFIAACEGD